MAMRATLRLRPRGWASALAARRLFIQTESTPNPASLKFLPNEAVLPPGHSDGEGVYIRRSDARLIARSPLAKKLFGVDGVEAVFLGPNFVTVNKDDAEAVSWDLVKPMVFSEMMEHFGSGAPALEQATEAVKVKGEVEEDDDEVVAMIKELLLTRIRPAVQEDGGDIFFDRFDVDTGVVYLEMAGSCAGCPSSSVTLKQGVENMLRHYIPEVVAVMETDSPELMQSSRDETLDGRLRAAGIPRD